MQQLADAGLKNDYQLAFSLIYTYDPVRVLDRLPGAYPSDVSEEEWAFILPYLLLPTPDAANTTNTTDDKEELRNRFNALRWVAGTGAVWQDLPESFPPWQLAYEQTQQWVMAGCFQYLAADSRSLLQAASDSREDLSKGMLGEFLSRISLPAEEKDHGKLMDFAGNIMRVSDFGVGVAYVERGFVKERGLNFASRTQVRLEFVKWPSAVRGFVLLPHQWMTESSSAWQTRFAEIIEDCKRLSETLAW